MSERTLFLLLPLFDMLSRFLCAHEKSRNEASAKQGKTSVTKLKSTLIAAMASLVATAESLNL